MTNFYSYNYSSNRRNNGTPYLNLTANKNKLVSKIDQMKADCDYTKNYWICEKRSVQKKIDNMKGSFGYLYSSEYRELEMKLVEIDNKIQTIESNFLRNKLPLEVEIKSIERQLAAL